MAWKAARNPHLHMRDSRILASTLGTMRRLWNLVVEVSSDNITVNLAAGSETCEMLLIHVILESIGSLIVK